MSQREMLDRWAEKLTERQAIADFWQWLVRDGDYMRMCDVDIEQSLDEYHDINQAQLDRERRALLSANARRTFDAPKETP